MMRIWLTLLMMTMVGPAVVSAQPALRWHKSFGGEGNESVWALMATEEGGLMVFGYSNSPTNEVKQAAQFGYSDFWVVAVDANGEKLWDRSYGGTGVDELRSLARAPGGGYLIGGASSSTNSGNKTSAGFGQMDYWVIRIDAAGNPLWDRTFGGTAGDNLRHIEPLSDGGFLLSGTSQSGTDGNKTARSNGWGDGWIIRLDTAGEVVWQKSVGGTSNDEIDVARQLPDGGFLLVGSSNSLPSGDKTEMPYGWEDVWIVRLDANGNKLWDRTYGGNNVEYSHDLILLPGGDAIVLATSLSGVSGNKQSPNRGKGAIADAWLLRINPEGKCVWEQTYGGASVDRLMKGTLLTDGLLLIGHSSSSPSGNKTSPRYGWDDFWMVRIDFDGRLLWENTLGSGGNEGARAVQVFPNGDFALAGGLIAINGQSPQDVPVYGLEDFYVARFAGDQAALGAQRTETLRLTLHGSTNLWYRTDCSTDLQTWTAWRTNQLSASSVELTDVADEPRRFYRARIVPPPDQESRPSE